jgi:membrane-associated phospholipid phosphatase
VAAPLVSPWTDDKPITHFFQNFGKDLKALGSPESAWVLLSGGVAAGALHPQDDNVAAWVHAQPTSSSAADVGNAIGSGWTQVLGAFGMWAAGKGAHNDALAHVGSDLIRAQAVNELLTDGLKVATGRTRPNGGSYSFPSGHTSSTFATAAVIQSHFGWLAGAAGYGVASFVGWSRVRSDHHWVSDVVFGSAIGVISGRAVARTHTSKWTVAPVKTPGGFAVFATRR